MRRDKRVKWDESDFEMVVEDARGGIGRLADSRGSGGSGHHRQTKRVSPWQAASSGGAVRRCQVCDLRVRGGATWSGLGGRSPERVRTR